MRRFSALLAAATFAGAVFVAAPASANPSGKCATPTASAGPVSVKTGTDGANSFSVCLKQSGAPSGALTASQKSTGGYIVVDGDLGNQAFHPCLDGYVGLQVNSSGYSGPVSDSNGDYTYPKPQPAPPNPTALCT